jgi:DNA mismatch endonuclease, patch repair protein
MTTKKSGRPVRPSDPADALPDGSWASSPGSRRSMQGNRSQDTSAELAVRRLLHAAGLRYRVNTRPVPAIRRRADVVFPRRKIAVFIDGCFWHACPDHFVPPKSNVDYWKPKIDRNQARDRDTNAQLLEAGWSVLRYWSHEEPATVARAIVQEVRGVDRRSK